MASEDLPANGHGGPADPVKADFRRYFRSARRTFVASLNEADRDRMVCSLAVLLDRHMPRGIVAGYRAVGDELDVCGVYRPLAFPRVTLGLQLTFHQAVVTAHCVGALGIPEPASDAPVVDPDVILVPLLGVDTAGTRLGQGGGYYDRTLAALRAVRPVVAVGIGWDIQLIDMLPADPWDAPLDALATPSGWRDFTTWRDG